MSDIGLILNGFLGVLLVGALILGWRLEQRLKTLRASHQSFAQAVGDLDRAATRAEQGLADLRVATDEATGTLTGRVERAGSLSAKLERLIAEATNVEARLAAAPPAAVGRESAFARFAERYNHARPAPIAEARTDLILEDQPAPAAARAPAATPAAGRPAPAARPALAARLERLRQLARPQPSRAALEEELFDVAPAPRRAAGGRQ
jgi:hypothetical protein